MITGNEPANPTPCYYNEEGEIVNEYSPGVTGGNAYGLTIRQQFAMAAMQGLSANPKRHFWDADEIAVISVEIADSLIAELNKAQ